MASTVRSAIGHGALVLGGVSFTWFAGAPDSALTWVALTVTHVLLVRSFRDPAVVAWLPLVAMATALTGGTNLAGVLLAASIGLAASGAPMAGRRAAGLGAAAAVALAVAAMMTSGLHVPPLFFAAGGAAVGAIVFVVCGAAGRLHGLQRLVEAAAAGAVAAALGHLASSVGPLLAPLVAAGVVVAAAPAFAAREVERAEAETVASLLRALEVKDLYTRGHGERVGDYARTIGIEMKLDPLRLARLTIAGRLHDIGKIAAPRQLLRKRNRLDGSEYCAVQHHVPAAATLLAGIEFLEPTVGYIAEHHVHAHGSGGYGTPSTGGPSLEARILAVADAFDAMTTHRPYRRALTREYALGELRRCTGTQFDGEVVAALVAAVEREEVAPQAVGVESDTVARLAALGVTDVPEVIGANF